MNLSPKTPLKKLSFLFRILLITGLLYSCATYNVKKGKNLFEVKNSGALSENEFKIFLIGDAGNADEVQAQYTLNSLKK
jgi:hypothetical protein